MQLREEEIDTAVALVDRTRGITESDASIDQASPRSNPTRRSVYCTGLNLHVTGAFETSLA